MLESSSVLQSCAADCFRTREESITNRTLTRITEVVSRLNSSLHRYDADHNDQSSSTSKHLQKTFRKKTHRRVQTEASVLISIHIHDFSLIDLKSYCEECEAD